MSQTHKLIIAFCRLVGRKVRPHEWNLERSSLTCWSLQDRIKSSLDRIETTGSNVQKHTMFSRLTTSQKYDSALSTWYNGQHGQIYLCQILPEAGEAIKQTIHDKPVFRPWILTRLFVLLLFWYCYSSSGCFKGFRFSGSLNFGVQIKIPCKN